MCRGLCYIAFQTAAPNLRECPTNRWTGATGSDFRIKRDPAKLLGSAVARSTQTLYASPGNTQHAPNTDIGGLACSDNCHRNHLHRGPAIPSEQTQNQT